MTIREIIQEKSGKFRDASALSPGQVAQEMVELSSLMSSLNAEISEWQYSYNCELAAQRDKNKSAADAKIFAQASSVWKELDARLKQKEALVELIRSAKYLQKSQMQELNEFTK